MRSSNLGSIPYQPAPVPVNSSELSVYLLSELAKIQAAIAAVSLGHLDKTYTSPTKSRDGDIRYADGTQWNPGSGQGIYYYRDTTWIFLG